MFDPYKIIDPWDQPNKKTGDIGHKNRCVTIYKFNDTKAIKYVDKKLDQDGVHSKLLKHEFNILNSLDHPGVARVYNLVDNEYYIYFETDLLYVDLFSKQSDMTMNQKKEMVNLIKYIIKYLYDTEIVHRDLTLKNIMIRDNMPVLIDFQSAEYLKQNVPFEQSLDMAGRVIVNSCCGQFRSVNFQDVLIGMKI